MRLSGQTEKQRQSAIDRKHNGVVGDPESWANLVTGDRAGFVDHHLEYSGTELEISELIDIKDFLIIRNESYNNTVIAFKNIFKYQKFRKFFPMFLQKDPRQNNLLMEMSVL